MQRHYLFLVFCACTICLAAQPKYKDGYLIDERGRRESVRILDRDWVDNPSQFRFLTGAEQQQRGTTATVREFGYDDGSLRYLRAVAAIDQSGDRADELSSSEQPEYQTDTVFLEWLVDGEADLFYYEDGETRRFFYRVGESDPRPLINRRYRRGQEIIEQSQFRGQLRTEINCDYADVELRRLDYNRRDLVAYFESFNECRGTAYQTTVRKPAAGALRLYLRSGAGYHFGTVSINSGGIAGSRRELGGTLGARVGLEVEAVIPLANENWSVFGEIFVQRVSTGRDSSATNSVSLNLRSLNVPLGVRRYFHIGAERSLFLQAIGMFQFPWNSYTFVTSGTRSRGFDASWNFGLGAGAGYRSGRWLIEARYTHDQDILQQYIYAATYYRSLSLVAGYRLIP